MPVEDVRVVIVGQDPYPMANVATGIAFAVDDNTPSKHIPPSLQILQTSLAVTYYDDICFNLKHLSLKHWVEQGVLLLNASLSCDLGYPEDENFLFIPNSHSCLWRIALMEELFSYLDDILEKVVFVFMGKKALYYKKFIKKNTSYNTVHPIMDFRSNEKKFINSNIFCHINNDLHKYGKETISW